MTTPIGSQGALATWGGTGIANFVNSFHLTTPYASKAVAGATVYGNGYTVTVDLAAIGGGGFPGLFTVTSGGISIQDLTVDVPSTSTIAASCGGFVAASGGGTVAISTCALTGGAGLRTLAGGIVGAAVTGLSIMNCYSTAHINSDGCGGIVGANCTGTITTCLAIGNVDDAADFASGIAGGDDGATQSPTINQCYTTGNISSNNDFSGGICAHGLAPVLSCYTTGAVSNGNFGVVGFGTGGAVVTNCYTSGALLDGTCAIIQSWPISHCFGMFATTLVGSTGLVPFGSTPTASGFGSGTWPAAPNSPYDTGILLNTLNSDTFIWSDQSGNSPPVASGPFLLTAFMQPPWNHTTFNETRGFLPLPPPLCFGRGTRILCAAAHTDTCFEVAIEELRVGTGVVTHASGVKRVVAIGSRFVDISDCECHPKDGLYALRTDAYKALTRNLLLTGAHGILTDELTPAQVDGTIALHGRVFVTEGCYRLMAFLDPRAVRVASDDAVEACVGEESEAGVGSRQPSCSRPRLHRVWHFALENDEAVKNYGVRANGLLVETASCRHMQAAFGSEAP